MRERFARRRFLGAATTLVLAGLASLHAWLGRAVLASQLPRGDHFALDIPPTDTPATAPPAQVPAAIPSPTPLAPIFAHIWDATDALARRG